MSASIEPAEFIETPSPAANRSFWQFWTASTVSTWGTSVTAVAMPTIALTYLHASAFEVSFLTAAAYAAWLLIGLPAGALVQRYSLRAVQVTMDMSRAVVIASIPIAYAFDVLSIAQLVVVALVVGFADVLFAVGNSTFLPRIVPKSELTRRNSIFSGTNSVSQFAAPAFAGALIAVIGPVLSIIVDAVSYVLSSFVLRRLPDSGVQPRKENRSILHDINEGIAFVWQHPVMRPCVLAVTVLNFGCGALTALLPVFVIRGVEASPTMIGVILAAEGVGSLLGAFLVGSLVKRFGSARTVMIALAIAAAGAVLFPLSQGPLALLTFGAGNLVCAVGVVMFSVVTRSHRQMETPPEMLSRVMGTVRFVSWGAIPFGALAGGLLGTWFVVTGALSLVTVAMLGSLLVALFSTVRRRRSLEVPEPMQPPRSAGWS